MALLVFFILLKFTFGNIAYTQALPEIPPGCFTCHNGPNFAGPALPAGVGTYRKFPTFPGSEYETIYHLTDDNGRFDVTKLESDRHKFRIPTLRNIALTAPYFHNGSVKTLGEAVRVMAKTQLGEELSDQDASEIIAFLNSLTGRFPVQAMPRLPEVVNESGLDD
jgi:cytochrome c peroxidase